ncbi:IgGFc-binding protein-like isoform X1 [Chiloscyllium plagiosum]|uniref:IgGFc-binding protein-like isoform X1 n=1 Tax=Chiloscyllium plagiosum TaxID=36176 RepID=UPI001CB86CC6|nr:IgGFc-binding protein-like isoform X1 [Chiloscyllium plagiosum]
MGPRGRGSCVSSLLLYILLCSGEFNSRWSASAAPTVPTAGSTGLIISGRRFVTVFLENHSSSAVLTLNIITYDKTANVNVSVYSPPLHRSQTIPASSSAVINLEPTYMLKGNDVSRKAILITSDVDISVVVLNTRYNTQDTFLSLPVANLGTTYYVLTYNGVKSNQRQFAVANPGSERVLVTITVVGLVEYNATEYANDQTFSFILEANQAVQFQSEVDMTGTKVASAKPVAVFSGNRCIMLSSADCDHIAEQLLPVTKWSYSFAVFPLLDKDSLDIITIMAAENDTTVNVYSIEGNVNVFLREGSHINLTVTSGMIVNSAKAVMVSYLSTGGSTSLVQSFDPFLVNVIPPAYFSAHYVFVTMANFYNYVLIVSSTPTSSQIILDGKPLASFQTENTTFWDFTATRVYLGRTASRYVIFHADSLFGIYVYGVARGESYAYSMGGKKNISIVDVKRSANFVCLSQAAEYTFPSSMLVSAGVTVSDVHLIDPTCRAHQQDENWIIITAPFDSCGTTVTNETGKIVYMNRVYGSIPRTPIHRLEIELKCEMSLNESITMGFMLQTNHLVRFGHYNVSFRFFRSINFNDPIAQFPYQAELNDTLFVQMEAETTDTGVQIFTDTCLSAPMLNSNHAPYVILQNGCVNDETFRTYKTNDLRKQRFSFHVFKFEDFPQVYIFCDLILCHSNSSPNRCERGCVPTRRKRELRSMESKVKAAHLSQGPIVFPASSLGGRANFERKGANYSVYMFGLLSTVCLSLITALILQRKYYLRQN